MNNNVIHKVDRRRARHEEDPEREVVRRSVLGEAARLLSEEGHAAFNVRNLARAVGRSTMVVYTLFGGMEGLAEALYLEGFRQLGEAVASVPDNLPPLEQLWGIARAYRRYAIENSTLYAVMFGGAIPGFVAVRSGTRSAHLHASNPGEAAVRRCIEAGVFTERDPAEMADALWATAHGAVSLELAGYFPEPGEAERRFELAINAVIRGLLRDS